MLAALAFPLINPIGYVGGGADDIHYLQAARCWAEAGGPCLPTSHWDSRWPAIAPIGGIIALFGESRLTVGIGPFAAWLACVLLLFALGDRWFDRQVGALAALLFAATPVVAQMAFQPGADTTELALQLGALLLATIAFERQSALVAAAAGALAAVAVQARDTSLLFCGAAALGWLLLDRDRRRVLLWALAGFAAVLLAEMAAYAIATGDPLYRHRLALGHGAVRSEELAEWVDTSRSPLFNPDYIAGWKRSAGISLWWPIDPWLNLLGSFRIGLILAASLLAAAFGWRSLAPPWKRTARPMLGFALLIAAGLIYALAVDPKPRMFLLLAAASGLTLAAVAVASWRAGRGLVPAAVAGLIVVAGAYFLVRMGNTHAFERTANRWVAANPALIEIDSRTRTALTLVPRARALPPAGSGRPLRIVATNSGCEYFGVPVVDRVGGSDSSELCLLKLPPR